MQKIKNALHSLAAVIHKNKHNAADSSKRLSTPDLNLLIPIVILVGLKCYKLFYTLNLSLLMATCI